MPQLLAPARPSQSRVSRVLPTVKCSNCTVLVPLASLGDHVCRPQLPHQPMPSNGGQPSPHSRPGDARGPAPNPPPNRVHFPIVATHPPRPEDYMPGGPSGMAGVGRRAFQVAAQAAIFTQHHRRDAKEEQPLGIHARKPEFLDINSASGRGTPPLSPNSAHSSPRSHSPLSPLSQSPLGAPAIATSRTPSPTPPTTMLASRSYSNPARLHQPNGTIPPAPAPTAPSRTPFLQRYKNTLDQALPGSPASSSKHDPFYTPRAESKRPDSPTDSDDSGTGLAYARDDDAEAEAEQAKLGGGRVSLDNDAASTSSHSAYSAASKPRFTRDDLPSPRRSHTTPTVGPRGGPGGLASPLGSVSPPGATAARSASDARTARREKDRQSSRPRVCIRCERKIEDGRWVKTDTNKGVLCERCWKNMYLPKCRRCDKPIEQAAVYSSDGQLKGKYHRDCFNCHTCHKAFPDKSFYVYDGHPMCAFHYHQANRSLCAAPACGRPVEGPCAITYAGDRFHPECLRCAHPACEERLDDYWEVDGEMLCERHAQRDVDEEDDVVGELERIPSVRRPPRLGSREARAQKRTTRLINLANGAF